MEFPTIHLNGTSKRELLEQYTEASHAVDAALDALYKAGPNGRDYYVQSASALYKAQDEHYARIKKLREVKQELDDIALHVADAEGGRR